MIPDPEVALSVVAVCASAILMLLALAVGSSLALSEDAQLPRDAKRRAREVFVAHLNGPQRRSWRMRRRFAVTSASGRRYTISSYRPFNIRTDGAVFCVQVEGEIPIYDKLLAQKLLVEIDEQRLFACANVRSYSRAWHERIVAARAATS